VGVAGFAAGGYIIINLLDLLGLKLGHVIWLPYLIGGVVGALLLYLIFDWALIFVSSLSGASLIIQAVNLNPRLELGVYIALVILGIIIQTRLYQKSQSVQGENDGS
jgi:glucose-6-phosphate-specific signal transduction histidine kinase